MQLFTISQLYEQDPTLFTYIQTGVKISNTETFAQWWKKYSDPLLISPALLTPWLDYQGHEVLKSGFIG